MCFHFINIFHILSGNLVTWFFQQVFDVLRTIMFVLGMAFVFIGISLLAPDDPKGILNFASCHWFTIILNKKRKKTALPMKSSRSWLNEAICVKILGLFFCGLSARISLCWGISDTCQTLSLGYLKFYILLKEFTKSAHVELPF